MGLLRIEFPDAAEKSSALAMPNAMSATAPSIRSRSSISPPGGGEDWVWRLIPFDDRSSPMFDHPCAARPRATPAAPPATFGAESRVNSTAGGTRSSFRTVRDSGPSVPVLHEPESPPVRDHQFQPESMTRSWPGWIRCSRTGPTATSDRGNRCGSPIAIGASIIGTRDLFVWSAMGGSAS